MSFIGAVNLPWNLDVALMAVLFLEVGYIIQRSDLLHNLESKPGQGFILVVFTLIIGLVAIALNSVETVDFDGNIYGNVVLMIIGALGITIPLMYIAMRLDGTRFIMGFDYFTGSISHTVLERIGIYNWVTQSVMKMVILTIGIIIWTAIIHLIPNKSIRRTLSL